MGHSFKASLLVEAPLSFVGTHLSEQTLRISYTEPEFPLVSLLAFRFCFNVYRNRKQITFQASVIFRKS